MNIKLARTELVRSALGAALAVLCGLALWKMPLGEAWVHASYDYLFRFSTRAVTNQVVFIAMDNESYDRFHQSRGEPWDRGLHARLLDKLADDGCALVVFDTYFRKAQNATTDAALAQAMGRQRAIVLMAEQAHVSHPTLTGARPTLPAEPFLTAARSNWGVAWVAPELDSVVRRHWPNPSPGPYPSLPWTAARMAGASLNEDVRERWLRYYDRDGAWTTLSYPFAMDQAPNYFRDKTVFIGIQPKTSAADGEPEEFRTPSTRWTGESIGGAELMITAFLNLVNKDSLYRSAGWMEGLVLTLSGLIFGGLFCRWPPWITTVSAAAAVLVVTLGAVLWSHFTNYWFPWLVIAAGQTPAALAWALATRRWLTSVESAREVVAVPKPALQPARAQASPHSAD